MADEGTIPLEEAARRLGKTANALRKQATKGTILAWKRGGRWFVRWPVDEPKQAPQTSLATLPATSPNVPDTGEVAYLRAELHRARQEALEERHRHEEQIKDILAGFRATVTEIAQRQLPPPEPVVVVEPAPVKRRWWRWWGR